MNVLLNCVCMLNEKKENTRISFGFHDLRGLIEKLEKVSFNNAAVLRTGIFIFEQFLISRFVLRKKIKCPFKHFASVPLYKNHILGRVVL